MMTERPSHGELQQRVREPETGKAEQSVQDEALRNLFNLSLDMLCMADLDGYFRIVNPAFENTLGYDRQVLLSTPFIEFVHPDDTAKTLEALSLLEAGESLTYFENRYRCHDGSYKWIAWTCSQVTDEGCMYAVARDITQQKTTQRELENQHDLFDQVLSNVPASIFWKDRNSVYLGVNDQFARDAGLQSPDDIIGKSDYDLVWTREEADFYRECDRKVMGAGEPMINIEESQLQADGKEVNLLTNKVPLLDKSGQVYGMLGIYMNITEHKKATTALAISERRFRTIFNSSYQLIGLLDPDGTLLEANQTALDLGRLRQEDVVGRQFWETYWWRYSTAVQDRLKAAIRDASQGNFVRYEEAVLDGDGEIRTIDFTLKPVLDQQNNTVLIIAEGSDITDIKLAEEETQQHHQEMAHIIRLGTAWEMSSGIAHELNQPLTAIVSYCGTAASLVDDLLPPPKQLCEILKRTEEQAHRASAIIRHFREFISKGSDHIEILNLDELIRDIIIFLKYEVQKSGVRIDYYPGFQTCNIKADRIQIEQVLINLVRNSMEAIVHAGTAAGRVILRTRLLPNNSVAVTVTDNGPGVDAEILKKIFHPFQTSKESGMGIGLSLCRRIIEAHGGELWVDKDYLNGALFGFELPVAGEQVDK
jgi:PAS domain S-box-containing protein